MYSKNQRFLKIIYLAGWFGLIISVLAPGGADLQTWNFYFIRIINIIYVWAGGLSGPLTFPTIVSFGPVLKK